MSDHDSDSPGSDMWVRVCPCRHMRETVKELGKEIYHRSGPLWLDIDLDALSEDDWARLEEEVLGHVSADRVRLRIPDGGAAAAPAQVRHLLWHELAEVQVVCGWRDASDAMDALSALVREQCPQLKRMLWHVSL